MKLPAVSIIAAMTLNGVIGNKGVMPWRIKRDMDRFKKLTTPSAVVMGPKTFASLKRPLVDRLNIVLTTNRRYEAPAGVLIAHDERQALDMAATRGHAELFAIGGASIYTTFLQMPLAEHLFITHINSDMEGDTHFPHWKRAEWRKVWKEEKWVQGEEDDYATKFAEYRRVQVAQPGDSNPVLFQAQHREGAATGGVTATKPIEVKPPDNKPPEKKGARKVMKKKSPKKKVAKIKAVKKKSKRRARK